MEIVNTNPAVLVAAIVVIAVVGLILYFVHKRMSQAEDLLGEKLVAKLRPVADEAAEIVEEAKERLEALKKK